MFDNKSCKPILAQNVYRIALEKRYDSLNRYYSIKIMIRCINLNFEK